MIAKILIGIIGLCFIYIVIKGGLQLKIEYDELEMIHIYNLLVIYKEFLTGKDDGKFSYDKIEIEIKENVGYLFNPFNFKTLLPQAIKRCIIQYFKDNYYVLNETKKSWPEQAADIERMRRVIDQWI